MEIKHVFPYLRVVLSEFELYYMGISKVTYMWQIEINGYMKYKWKLGK